MNEGVLDSNAIRWMRISTRERTQRFQNEIAQKAHGHWGG